MQTLLAFILVLRHYLLGTGGCNVPLGMPRLASIRHAILRGGLALIALLAMTVQAQAQVNNAMFVSQNVPTTMVTGQTYTVSVTLKNSGTTTWTVSQGYQLGAQNPADNKTWNSSGRVELASFVDPGAQRTLTFNVTAPGTPGTYHFQWRMVKGAGEWFGDLTPDVAVTVVAGPTLTVTRTPTPLIAGQSYTTTWSSTNATAVSYACTPSGTGFSGSATLAASGSATGTASADWVGNSSICIWTATGPNGSKSLTELLTTVMPANGVPVTPAPTLSVTRTPSPLIAGNSYTLQWSSTNATAVSYNCTAGGTGFTGSATLAVSGATNGLASSAWVGYPSSCTWTATGPGGSKTLTETLTTVTSFDGAAFVSQNVPTAMVAGQTYPVSVTLKNSGTTTWTVSQGYQLGAQNPADNKTWNSSGRVELASFVDPGAQRTLTFNVTAPGTPGTYHFQWRMVKGAGEWFGDLTPDVAVTVVAGPTLTVTRTPTPLIAGQSYTTTWSSTNATAVSYACTSSGTSFSGSATLAASGSATGTASADWVGNSSICIWTATGPNGSKSLTELLTTVAPADGATVVAQSVPAAMQPGQTYPVSVTLKNSGSSTWTAADGYQLGAQNPADNKTWTSSGRVALNASVAPGAQTTFSFNATAPATPGTYHFQWRMVKGAAAWFGDLTPDATVTVANAAVTGTVTYFHNDAAGTPLLATDANGNVLWRENYRPYGEKLVKQPASANNRIGYAGKPYDDNTELSYFGARYYMPNGRFMSMDPLEPSIVTGQGGNPNDLHTFNRYAYANNNPYKFVDPDGRSPLLLPLLGLGLLANEIATSDVPMIGGGTIGRGIKAAEKVAAREALGTTKGFQVTDKGLARVEAHLSKFGDAPENTHMLGRLRSGMTTEVDKNFYMHELKESSFMKRGMDYDSAHQATLGWQGIPYKRGFEAQLYHPDAMKASGLETWSNEALHGAGLK